MGVAEEGGRVASSIVEGLKTNPSCLAALAVVALFAILQYFDDAHQSERMIQRAEAVEKLLQECIADNIRTRSIDKEPRLDKPGSRPVPPQPDP